jgi:hypothetical protein
MLRLIEAAWLVEHCEGSGLDRLKRHSYFILVEAGTHHDNGRGHALHDPARRFEAIHLRHVHVHDHDVRFEPFGLYRGLEAISSRAHDLNDRVLIEHVRQDIAYHRRIFSD